MAVPYVLRLRRCWRLGVSNHPYWPLAIPFRAFGVIARTMCKCLGGQHLIVAAIPGLSQERCCETTRADLSVAWVPPASPLPSSSAQVCLGKGRVSCEAMILASIWPSWTCHSSFQKLSCKLVHLIYYRHNPQGDHVSPPPPYTWLLTFHNEGAASRHPEDAQISSWKSDQDCVMGPRWDLTHDLVLP